MARPIPGRRSYTCGPGRRRGPPSRRRPRHRRRAERARRWGDRGAEDQAERQPRDSILPALAVANEDLAALDVEALHAELGAFKQTEAGTAEEGRQKERDAGHAIQESAHLGLREHRGALRSGEIDVLRGEERDDVGVEEEDGGEGLCVEALTSWSVARCVKEERLDVGRTEIAWMAAAMEENERPS
jgi:hypothetical protein